MINDKLTKIEINLTLMKPNTNKLNLIIKH